ncbi:MAG: family 10 glycosylhydrolase [Candidatus Aegiribacteria sp.]|nr:family 10 glycosylhydrolase [Candidatus Aegiribacteria sp.]MBD3294785.1 family 10 glycosylhydrolase [Candidatus Fermentibacteria bacterium]
MKTMILVIALTATLPFAVFSLHGECRYFWMVRDALETPETIDAMLYRAAEAGANGVVVQVCGRGRAYFDSQILPPAPHREGFDPLSYTISKARPLGLEVHAWVNAFLVWSSPQPPSDSSHVWHLHPEWFMTDRYGRSTRDYTRAECEQNGLVGATLSPALPGVRAFVAAICSEVAENYNVDGIHLDYIRYPNPSFGYEKASIGAFYLSTGMDPLDMFRRHGGSDSLSRAWSEWKKTMVTRTVETVRSVLRSRSPGVQLSCAVMADSQSAASHYSCDWRQWLKDDLVDFVCTMAYTDNPARAVELALETTEVRPGKVVHGIGIYNQPIGNALIGAASALENGSGGVCMFSINSLSDDSVHIVREFWSGSAECEHSLETAVIHRLSTGTKANQ